MDVPLTAWQQAVIVSLFAVIFITLMGLLIRWFSGREEKWQEFERGQQAEWRKFQEEQNRGWRETVADLSASWQKWQAEQAKRECASMDRITEALNRLSERLDEHDERVEERVNLAIEAVHNRATARRSSK